MTGSARRPGTYLVTSHSDQQIAQAFAGALQEEGIETWLDTDQIAPGDSISRRVDEGLESADAFVFFLSAQSLGKTWMRHELNSAMARRLREPGSMRIIPILVEDVEIPALLRDFVYLDVRDGDVTRAARKLATALRDLGQLP